MPTYSATIATPKPADEAFAYMADFRSAKEWDPTVPKTDLIGAKPPGPEAEFLITVRLLGRETDYHYKTVVHEAPARLVLRAETSSVISQDTVTVRATPEGSELTYDADLQPKGAMKLASPLLALLFNRLGANAAKGLARELSGKVV